MSDTDTQPEPKPKLRWYQYRLWHLFLLMTLCAILSSVFVVDSLAAVVIILLFTSLLIILLLGVAEPRLRRTPSGKLFIICGYVLAIVLALSIVVLSAYQQ